MKADPRVLTILGDLLAAELTAVDQYLAHGEMYADMGLQGLADVALHESEHEGQHARAIIQRILFLEGKPDLATREQMHIGTDVPSMLQADLDLEFAVVKNLKAAIAEMETLQDYVSRDMLVVQLDDTETDHAYYLEKQLRLINMVGLQNYLQSQISGDPNAAGAGA